MNSKQFKALFGFIGIPAKNLADHLEVKQNTLYNYIYGRSKVPDDVAEIVTEIAKKKGKMIGVKIDPA